MTRSETGTFAGAEGTRLFFESWVPDSSKAALLFIHGLSEHGGRYRHVAEYFSERGFSFHIFDLRGHGRSEGRRGDGSFQDFLEDIPLFLQTVLQNGKQPFFLVGHSFGGQLLLNYLAGKDGKELQGLRGALFSSPNIRLKMNITPWKVWLGSRVAEALPALYLSHEIPARFISHDSAVVAAYEQDPFVFRKVTARLGALILKNQESLLSLAPRIRIPVLMMHGGGDQIADPEGTREFYFQIPVEDKRLNIYEGAYHEIFNEPEQKEVFQDMEEWITSHL